MIKKILITLMALLVSNAWAQEPCMNSIRQSLSIEVADGQSLPKPDMVRQSQECYTGFGLSYCTAALDQSPSGNDIIYIESFDPLGRNVKTYLPFAGALGTMANMLQEQSLFYRTGLRLSHTNYPFQEYTYDASSGGRVHKQSYPGLAWRMGSGNEKAQRYLLNAAAEIRCLKADDNGNLIDGGFYLPNTIRIIESSDEEGISSRQYLDKHGVTLLEVKAAGTIAEAKTYHVQDHYGRPSIVIPPKAVKALELSAIWTLSTLQEDLIFTFSYDGRDRVVGQKVPSGSETHQVFDRMGRPIMTQDANLKPENKWRITVYDLFDRVVLEGLFHDDQARSFIWWQNLIDSVQTINPLAHISARRNTGPGQRYNFPSWLPATSIERLRQFFYDDYQSFTAPAIAPSQQESGNSNGRLCAVESMVLETTPQVKSMEYYYYDADGNMSRSLLDFPDGSRLESTFRYNLLSETLSAHKAWSFPAGFTPSHAELDLIQERDRAGRMKTVKLRLNGEEHILASHNFNEIGQLIESNLGSVNKGKDFLQSIDYSYNPRAWLTSINNAQLSNDKENLIFSNESESAESLSSIVFDEIAFKIEELNTNGEYEINFNEKKIYEYELNQSSMIRRIAAQESETRELESEQLDSVAVIELEALEGDMLLIDFQSLELSEGQSAQSVLDTAISLISKELFQSGLTAPELIQEISNAVVSYLKSGLSRAYKNDDSNDLFGMELSYESPTVGSLARYNGNISRIQWKAENHSSSGMRYDLVYDELSRLKSASYSFENADHSWSSASEDYSVQALTYDANGNILTMQRRGLKAVSGTGQKTYGPIDDLLYQYSGNRLMKLTDAIPGTMLSGFNGSNPASSVSHFRYDGNGNLIEDLQRGIILKYNSLGLAKQVSIPNRSTNITTIYDASGRKLQQSGIAGTQTESIRYYGDAVAEGQVLSFITHPYGRIAWINGKARVEYDLKDHLGNIRVSFCDADQDHQAEVLREMHYYPFGMEMAGRTKSAGAYDNPFQFNGKELVGRDILNWYDFGARLYDPELGRWHAVDGMAGYATDWSPYRFGFDNPVKYSDPTGLFENDDIIIQSMNGTELRRITTPGEDIYIRVDENAFNQASSRFLMDNKDYNTMLSVWSLRNQEQASGATNLISEQIGVGLSVTGSMRDNNNLLADATLTFQVLFDNGGTNALSSYKGLTGGFGNGPLENGRYFANNYRDRGPSGWYSAGMNSNGIGFSYDLSPQFNTGRTQLRIHPDGNREGTLGCIGLVGDKENLTNFTTNMNNYLLKWSIIPVEININGNPNNNGR